MDAFQRRFPHVKWPWWRRKWFVLRYDIGMAWSAFRTHEEMAAELTRAGWRVKPPLTQENCPHYNKLGSLYMAHDGSGSSETRCPDCGQVSKSTWPARENFNLLQMISRN